MQSASSKCLGPCSIATAVVMLAFAAVAYGADSYNPATRQITIPSVAIGHATYSNMIVAFGSIVSGPSGSTPAGSEDTYNPGTNQLTMQSVIVGTVTYQNVVVTVAGLVTIGSVSGADIYSGSDLGIALVQTGSNIFSNVHVTVGSVISVAGGMPTYGPDTYDSASNQLAIPAVQVANRVYTNVVISPGHLNSIGGLYSTVQVSNLYSFTAGTYGIPNSTDGVSPWDSVVQGRDLKLYGTTVSGGTSPGTVFAVDLSGNESVLHAFTYGVVPNSTDGRGPQSCLIQGKGTDNNFYGTTEGGGTLGGGTVFSISPTGSETVLYSFGANGGVSAGGDGLAPTSCLVEGVDGNFYGTTPAGGKNQRGTVYMVTPGGTETILHSFSGDLVDSVDGDNPVAGLVLGKDGNFYGTTFSGGQHNVGTLFKMTPAGVLTLVHSFSGGSAGGFGGNLASGGDPTSSPILGSDGNFYGMTRYGGAYDEGAVYRVTPAGVETLLHSFSGNNGITGSTDGAIPFGGVIQGSDGNFYGMTSAGGAYYRSGTLFKVTPTGVATVLHAFSGNGAIPGSTDAVNPLGSLVQASDGNFYGTAPNGGTYQAGTVFKVTGAIITH
jgi:uncharacterized repeat protein (TIGR03803 family)